MSDSSYQSPLIPKAYIWRRFQSLAGLWLVLFLIEHLLVNSQAALFVGDNGSGFVRAVNSIRELPYLPVIEIFLLGVPFIIHAWWGIRYLFSAEYNSFPSDGSYVELPQYPRNQAYTWQRITSWLLLVGVIAHVVQMRILDYPASAPSGTTHHYFVRVQKDEGLASLSPRLGFDLYEKNQIEQIKQGKDAEWVQALEYFPLQEDQVLIAAPSFGVAELMMVRDTFKSPVMMVLYTAFVLAACFHAFNGLWTFMIKWGITLTVRSQWWMRSMATFLMVAVCFLGLAAIWGTYWINLKT